MTDDQRETLISHNYQKMVNAKTPHLRKVYLHFMARLISNRTPEQVKRMESKF